MPYSSITTVMNGSTSPLLTPAADIQRPAKECLAMASAIGERTAFCEHMNRTLWMGRPDAPAATVQPFQWSAKISVNNRLAVSWLS